MKELNILELLNINGGSPSPSPSDDFEAWAVAQKALREQSDADLWAEWTRIYGQYQQ